ncbi:MAG: hypothetical protein FWE69_07235 [Clostridiales bacterium]|nr:hypothetical protein [Clostridiales bacterium]
MGNGFAVIDIGSNSIRYMTAASERGLLRCGAKQRRTTRLATGLLETGRLRTENLIASAAVVRGFCAEAAKEGLFVCAYATSAVRDAENRAEFLSLLESIPNLRLEILSGEEEARLAYLGATKGQGGTVIDIGGGSLQVATAKDAVSAPSGAIRAKEFCAVTAPDSRFRIPDSSLETMKQMLAEQLFALLPPPSVHVGPYYGVGGTITTLGALLESSVITWEKRWEYLQPLLAKEYCTVDDLKSAKRALTGLGAFRKNSVITRKKLWTLLKELHAMGPARAQHPLLESRHDTIIPGGLLLLNLMEKMRIDKLTPSHADGLEGYAQKIMEERGTKL